MSKLVLKFESSVLQEVAVGQKEVSIGRSPDNGIVIDNPAVSNYHARVFTEEGRLMLQDFGSLNGTFVNDCQRGDSRMGMPAKVGRARCGDVKEIQEHKRLDEFANVGRADQARNGSVPLTSRPKHNGAVRGERS